MFNSNMLQFVGLINNCVIDWFDPWPEQALVSVANKFISTDSVQENIKKTVVSNMVQIHQDIIKATQDFFAELRRMIYVTPKNYLDFIQNYKNSLHTNRVNIDNMYNR